jgi:hypothetical protein
MVESPVKKLKINKKANRYDQKSGYTPAIQHKKIAPWGLNDNTSNTSIRWLP